MPSNYDQVDEEVYNELEGVRDINEASEEPEEDQQDDQQNESSTEEISDEDGQNSNGQQEQSQGDDFDPTKWTLRFRGKEITPRNREHLITLAHQGYLYNQKAQEMSAREREMAEKANQYSQYEKLVQAFQQNPELKQRIMQMYHEAHGGRPGNQQPVDNSATQQLMPYIEKINTLEQKLKAFDDRQADEELKSEMEGLKSRYSEDWDTPTEAGKTLMWEILNHAHKNNFRTLEQAYRDYMWDTVQTRTRSEALKASAEKKRNMSRQGIVSTRPSQKAPPQQRQMNLRDMSYDDITKHIISDMK